MGKQRYWSGHGRTATVSTRRSLRNNNNHDIDPNGFDEASNSTSAGCMCAVFQLFDFHPLNQHHQPPQSPLVSIKPISPPLDDHISTGTEAPRNSLESDEESPLSCTPKQKEDGLHFPKGIVKIKTKSGIKGSVAVNSNESGSSPSTKTPTLVARLMGLDLLPQSNSPNSTTPRTASASPIHYPILQKPKTGNVHLMGSRSLPETPRTSCERKSNVENYHHRLSLQIPNYDKENASPSHYAKEIVKQVKESVSSRKAGLNDITNYKRRDQEVINQTKPKKAVLSSRMRSALEPKNLNKASTKVEAIQEGGLTLGTTKPKQKAVKTKVALKKKANKQEEPFVVPSKAAIDSPLKNSKKTPLSNELLSFSSVPTVVMKKHLPLSSPIKPTPMQSPCNRNQAAVRTGDKESERYLQSSNHQPHVPIIHHHQHVIQSPPKHHITAAADRRNNHDVTAELEYFRQLLLRRTTTSPSVNFLENYANTHCNVSISHRKLLSDLVEELLKPNVQITPERWPEVVEKLCEKVRKFPRAKCEVLEDIDGIIEKDLDILGIGRFEDDEGEGMVKEIEECIVEELLNETVRFVEETEMAGESRGRCHLDGGDPHSWGKNKKNAASELHVDC